MNLNSQNVTEMIENEKTRRTRYVEHGLTFQPQLYKIDKKNSPPLYYIKFDEICWVFTNIKKALDVLFKTFQVLNLEYPYENKCLWTFIQKFLYHIDTKYDIKSPCLSTFISQCK